MIETLTEREQEILVCLAEGLSNQEIADRLFLAEKTVRWYNSQIYSKLGAQNRREATARAASLGLLQPADSDVDGTPLHNLPAELTPFVGRHHELAELARLLEQDDIRLITLQGAGGMGKTRLALALARQQLQRYPDGVYFVPLAQLDSANSIVSETANRLGYMFSGELPPKNQLSNFLSRKRLLLVLDNFEHLMDGAALVGEMLRAAPAVKIVVTSREKLRLQGETSFPIGGMALPEPTLTENVLNFDAAALFVDAMHRIRSDLATTPPELEAVARICQLVGGMPLALLLAAAWVDVLSLDEIAVEISRSMDLLAAELHDAPARHHNIQAVFDPTWRRLTPKQQEVFMKLSVFRGGWTREAAQAIAGTSLLDLQALVNKSLIAHLPTGRYEIHELLRQYAAEKLEAAAAADATCAAHSHYFLDFLRQRERDIKGPRQLEVFDEIDADLENIFSAWRWGGDHAGVEGLSQALETLIVYATSRDREHEVKGLLRQARARFDLKTHPAAWAKFTSRYALLVMLVSDYPELDELEPGFDIIADIQRCGPHRRRI